MSQHPLLDWRDLIVKNLEERGLTYIYSNVALLERRKDILRKLQQAITERRHFISHIDKLAKQYNLKIRLCNSTDLDQKSKDNILIFYENEIKELNKKYFAVYWQRERDLRQTLLNEFPGTCAHCGLEGIGLKHYDVKLLNYVCSTDRHLFSYLPN